MTCLFCGGEKTERWRGNSGLEGTRCVCRAFSSYFIFQEVVRCGWDERSERRYRE